MNYLALLLVALFPFSAQADIVWPALYLASNTYNFEWSWVVLLGLIAEWFFYQKISNGTRGYTTKILLVANLVSTLLGVALIPLSGLLWELLITPLHLIFHIGTFHPVGWVGTIVFAALANTIVEGASLRVFFKIRFSKKVFRLLLIANLISVSLVGLTLIYHMPVM